MKDVDRGSVAIHCSTAFALDVVIQGDCIEVMRSWPEGCVNAIITDPPYGITANQWDNVPDLDAFWREAWRVCRGPVVMTASQPFTSEVVMSQRDAFKHEWIWQKNRGSNFANTVREPMKEHENVLVFAKSKWTYNPIRQSRTELQERFPSHVINKWLGQSSAVAEKHYLQTTDEHWQRAVDFRPPIGPPINGNQGPLEPIDQTKETPENPVGDGPGWVVNEPLVTPTGFEHPPKATGKTGVSDSRPPIGPPIPNEVGAIWGELSPEDRMAWIDMGRALLRDSNIGGHTQNTQ